MVGHDTAGWAIIQPMTRPAARARDLARGECRDTKHCIVIGARAWPLGVVSRYSLCIVTGARSG